MGNEGSKETAGSRLDEVVAGLGEALRAMVREEIDAVRSELGTGDGAGEVNISELVETEEFGAHVNGCMEKAFQTVLPQLIKRFKAEVEERITGSSPSGAPVDADALINSERMKELLDGRFRQMLLYIKQDVVPKAVQQKLERA